MTKKQIGWGALIVVVIIGGYFIFSNYASAPTDGSIEWEKQESAVKGFLLENFGNELAAATRPIGRVAKTVEVTGDTRPEALVLLGTGGAYTDDFILLKWEDGKPGLFAFLKPDGETGPLIFSQGSSVRNGMSVDFLLEESVVYTGSWGIDPDGSLGNCEVEAFRYWSDGKQFVFDKNASEELEIDYCSRIRNQLPNLL